MTFAGTVRASDIYSSPGKAGLLPISRSTWWLWVQQGFAPKPIKFGPKLSRWRAVDVVALLDKLPKFETPPPAPLGERMNALNQAILPEVSRAFDVIGQISRLRAEARAKEIAQLSGGRITASHDQVNEIAEQLKTEMIRDAARDVRASISLYCTTNQVIKG